MSTNRFGPLFMGKKGEPLSWVSLQERAKGFLNRTLDPNHRLSFKDMRDLGYTAAGDAFDPKIKKKQEYYFDFTDQELMEMNR